MNHHDLFRNFSLLSPENGGNYAELTKNTINDLSLAFLVSHLSDSDREKQILLSILEKMPIDEKIIRYRQEIYQDLRRNPELCQALREIFDSVQFSSVDYTHIRYSKANIWELLDKLRSLEQYCEAISKMHDLLKNAHFQSVGMKKLAGYIEEIYQNSGFPELSEDLHIFKDDVMSIQSMTLGINFNTEFSPSEIGIISLNQYAFREKGFLEKFIQFHRKRNPEDKTLTPFTMLSHAGNGTASESLLMNNLSSLIEEMLPSVTAQIKHILKRYTDMSGTALAHLGDELMFYFQFISLENKLEKAGFSCGNVSLSKKETSLSEFYNLRLALCYLDGTIKHEIICNPLAFHEKRKILILTGANQGGKTIFTQGIGIAFLLAQQGVFVPCSGGILQICDGIYTHFPTDENYTVSFGRLGEEAARFKEICRSATRNSVLLFNESFATTSHTESLCIAENALKYLCCLGARTCFNTHMHELAANPEKLHSGKEICQVVSVVMGKRNTPEAYRIHDEKPDILSYAQAIAEQYGITFEQLCEENLPEN